MSGQYLEAHAFLKTLQDNGVPYTETLVNLMQYAVIEEVAPVVHAKWLHNSTANAPRCSACGRTMDNATPYCPFCGAIMDEGHNDG